MIKNKRGAIGWGWVFAYGIIIVPIIIILLWWLIASIIQTCSKETTIEFSNWLIDHSPKFMKGFSEKVFGGKIIGGSLDTSATWLTNILGFNKSFCDFIPDLLMGFLVGLFIYIAYLLIGWITRYTLYIQPFKLKKSEITRIQSSWLNMIGGNAWKILLIGIIYAVMMQIPLLNSFINAITFKFLGVNLFIRAILIALYIGFLPGAIESYSRYRLRMYYYRKIMQTKYGIRNIRQAS